MATTICSNHKGVHTLSYESNESEDQEPQQSKPVEISVSIDDGELTISLYDRVPEDQGNVDVGGDKCLANHVTVVTLPRGEMTQLAQYFRQVAGMLERHPQITAKE